MEHAITIKDILFVALLIGAIVGVGGFALFLVWLFNPFRSGH